MLARATLRMRQPTNPLGQIAARQRLFDYAVAQGLAILNATLRSTTIAEVDATVEVPLLGGIDVAVRNGVAGGCGRRDTARAVRA